MEQISYPDRMFIEVAGIEKTPCVVVVRAYGRELASKSMYGSQSSCRLIIWTFQTPKGIRGEHEVVSVETGVTLTVCTPYASEGRGYQFAPVTFSPGYSVSVEAQSE